MYIEDNLGPHDENRDATGLLTFDYFLNIYKTALIWNIIQFNTRKNEIVVKRRKALQDGRTETWR